MFISVLSRLTPTLSFLSATNRAPIHPRSEVFAAHPSNQGLAACLTTDYPHTHPGPLAGPNGAGKTTFINRFLRQREETFRFVNPDEVARSLPPGPQRDLAAGRLVLERLDALFVERADVVLETTLATRSHAPRPPVQGRRIPGRTDLSAPALGGFLRRPRGAPRGPGRSRHYGSHAEPPFHPQPRLSGDDLQTAGGCVGGLCE